MAGETAYLTTGNPWFAGFGGVGVQPAKGFFRQPWRTQRPVRHTLGQMAYRLERGESVIAGLKRIAQDEIESAGAQLSGDRRGRDKAIHEARKSIKKVRALLRLVSAESGGVYPRENARLRDIAGVLSAFRDDVVIIETFDDLKRKFRKETRNRLRPVRAALTKTKNETGRAEVVGIVLDHAVAALGNVAKRVADWPLETDGFPALGPGLEKTYRAGRSALTCVRKDPRPDSYHELRKRVKDHWYHIRLLENLWTSVMIAYEKSLKDLETWLGDDHNLAVLREKIVAEPALYGEQKDIDLILDLIDKYQQELRDRSLSLAERIYEEKPSAFIHRMNHLWDTWRQEPKILEQSSARATHV
jgi:CHAD domain-containing protein